MAKILSLSALLIPFAVLFLSSYRSNKSWRQSFLSAWVIWGVCLTAITEILSLFNVLTSAALMSSWIVLCIAAFLRHYLSRRIRTDRYQPISLLRVIRSHQLLGFAVLSIAPIVLATGLLAIAVPPNNWDSMTYHMARVVNWMQHQTVAHYPTHILRQLDLAPWSSFAILHLQLLSGGDHFANLVQWSSMCGCVIGVSLIAKQLGANLTGQLLSSVFCVSIPMGLLQSVTTQNDYVVSFWLVCFTYNALLVLDRKITPRGVFELGASLGLAILTKATAYVYAFPFCLLSAIYVLRFASGRLGKLTLLGITPAIMLNAGHWWRNLQTFQNPLGISGDLTRNQLFTPSAVLSNIIRNVALHLPVPFQPINSFFEYAISGIHNYLLNIDINDPRTTFFNTVFRLPVTPRDYPIFLHEDTSGNLFHLVLILIAGGLYLGRKSVRNHQRSTYLAALLTTIVLFNILVGWQPWASRLHLPLFVLMAAFVGSVIGDSLRSNLLFYLLISMLTLSSLPYVAFSAVRPVTNSPHFFVFAHSTFDLPRLEQYFIARPNLREPYINAVQTLLNERCYDVGLYTGGNSWEYPFWAISHTLSPQKLMSLRAVNVKNDSNQKDTESVKSTMPCAIMAVDKPSAEVLEVRLLHEGGSRKSDYKRVKNYSDSKVQVFMR